uniref:Uncharacterized protein n=1 Tax=Rhizophora mucronata TaxID=61149 RepID=A0A2P2KEI1_RHIMU
MRILHKIPFIFWQPTTRSQSINHREKDEMNEVLHYHEYTEARKR